MAKIDQKYVDALNNFSKSLETIVELLQEQVKGRDTDILETMLKNMDSDKLNKIVEDLKEVTVTTKRIESKIDKMSKELEAIKSSKETGGFGQIVDPKNKNKIVDGIKIITLIAGGVLAIGLAFKIIGKVDVLSVLALGVSIGVITMVFAEVYEKFPKPDLKRTALISGMMVIVATAITVSSWMLSMVKVISIRQAVSATFTGFALGTSLWLISEAMKKTELKPKTIIGFMLLPFLTPIVAYSLVVANQMFANVKPIGIMASISIIFTSLALGFALYGVTKALSAMTWKGAMIAMLGRGAMLTVLIGAVAGGIVLASWLFSKITPISWKQGLTAIFVATTLGITMFLMGKVIKHTKDMTEKQALATGMVMLIIAGIIPAASYLLSQMEIWTFPHALGVLVTSLSIGISILAFTPAIFVLKKANLKWEDIAKVGVMMIGISAIIVATSWILDEGMYTGKYPSWKWSLEVGLSMVIFGGEIAALGFVVSKIGWQNLGIGAIAAVAVAAVMMISSWIISVGNYGTYPTTDWCIGTGFALLVFGGAMIGLGFLITATAGLGIPGLALGAVGTLMVAATMMLSSYVIGAGSYGTYPTPSWSAGVGLSLLAFGGSMLVLGALIAATLGGGLIVLALGSKGTLKVAETIVEVSKVLSKGTYGNGPTLEWATGVGLLIGAVAATMILTAFIPNKVLNWGKESLMIVSQTIVDVSKKLKEGTYEGGPTMEWSLNVATTIGSFVPLALLSSLFKGSFKDLFNVASSIVAVGLIFSYPVDWANAKPPKEWIEGVKSSILSYGEIAIDIRNKKLSLFDYTTISLTVWNILLVAKMLESQKTWAEIPVSWSNSVQQSVQKFIDNLVSLRDNSINEPELHRMRRFIWSIIDVADIFSRNEGIWMNEPPRRWVDSVSYAVAQLSLSMDYMRKHVTKDSIGMLPDLAYSILKFTSILAGSSVFGFLSNTLFGGSKETFVGTFSKDLVKLSQSLPNKGQVEGLWLLGDAINKISGFGFSNAMVLSILASTIKDLGKTLKDVDFATIDKLQKFSSTFTTISLIDNMKLNETISTLRQKKMDIKAVVDDSGPRFASVQGGTTSVTTVNTPFMDTGIIVSPLQQLVDYNKNMDLNIQELVKLQKGQSYSDGEPQNVSKPSRFGIGGG